MAAQLPDLNQRRFDPPSEGLYKQFETTARRFHPRPQQWQEPQVFRHNHYLVILRECYTEHGESGDCIQELYAACPDLCMQHVAIPINPERLKNYLRRFLQV